MRVQIIDTYDVKQILNTDKHEIDIHFNSLLIKKQVPEKKTTIILIYTGGRIIWSLFETDVFSLITL